MTQASFNKDLIDYYITPDVQCSFDPYDVWNTEAGQKVKGFFYRNRSIGFIPAGFLTVYDLYFNNKLRVGYRKREYPVVYAFRAMIALQMYRHFSDKKYIQVASKSLEWLGKNFCRGYSGYCWGANMPWVSKIGRYSENTPYITNTPYILEAIHLYTALSGDHSFLYLINSAFNFVEKDLKILLDDKTFLALSYSPEEEARIVINANSYAMFCYSLFLSYFKDKSEYIRNKIIRIYSYIKENQRTDGSWLYYADNKSGNFIDCFHSCFILKNLLKVNKIVSLKGCDKSLELGYNYLKSNFWDNKKKLFRRFSLSDKISMVKYDLYDNSEMLGLAHLLKDQQMADTLEFSIKENFVVGKDIYSQIIFPNIKINRNTLRWAVMPYLHSLSS